MGVRILAVLLVIGCGVFQTHAQQTDFREKTVILKLKAAYKDAGNKKEIDHEAWREAVKPLQVDVLFQKFPMAANTASRSVAVAQGVDLSLMYELHYRADVPIQKAIGWILASGLFEYAEPAYVHHVIGIPNDSLLSLQYHLEAIRAFEAWDVDTGSSGTMVAIVDTGVDWDHPDLQDQLHLNDSDLVDGLDNDSNGFIDDYLGWNFYENNNDPMETGWSHGTHVAGLACASTNNQTGVAGTGYATKLLAVKSGDKTRLTHGYEGIIYAVQRGADIINCSWGSTSYTAFGHDIVKYATEQGALVVCGAGNNNNELDFYPASFPESMSVAATDTLNHRAFFSTYNYNVDISAPGLKIMSTKNDTFDYDSGTSMSAPIVAGAAAIVRHRYPELSPAQVKAQLMQTALFIDDIPANEPYAFKLGSGLLDMRAALDSLAESALDLNQYTLTDNDDEVYVVGDEIELGIELINHLGSTGPISVTCRIDNPLLVVQDSVKLFPALSQNTRSNNFADPFRLDVTGLEDYNTEVNVQLIITDGNVTEVEWVKVLINPDFVNVTVNDVWTTVSSKGHLGYANNSRSHGLGFAFADHGNLLYEAGLMIGTESYGYTKVVDRVRGVGQTDHDFWPIEAIHQTVDKEFAAFRAVGLFSDSSAIEDEIGLNIRQEVKAWQEIGNRQFVIVEYTIINVGEKDLTDVYVGMYADWDVNNAVENSGATAFGKRLGYIYEGSDGLCGGIQSLNIDVPFYSFIIDNAGSGDINISAEGFSTEEKFIALSNQQWELGTPESPLDVSQVVSCGGFQIQRGDSVKAAFAIMAAQNTAELISIASESFKVYNGYDFGDNILEPLQVDVVYPNPTTGSFRVDFDLQTDQVLTFWLYDNRGNLVKRLHERGYYAGTNLQDLKLPFMVSGIYTIRITGENIDHSIPINYLRPE